VLTKGADEKIMPLCNVAPYTDETLSHLQAYAKVRMGTARFYWPIQEFLALIG
jgi:hypothetical protein